MVPSRWWQFVLSPVYTRTKLFCFVVSKRNFFCMCRLAVV